MFLPGLTSFRLSENEDDDIEEEEVEVEIPEQFLFDESQINAETKKRKNKKEPWKYALRTLQSGPEKELRHRTYSFILAQLCYVCLIFDQLFNM